MKARLLPSLLVLTVAALLCGCQTGAETRIQKNPELYGKLSSKDKERVSQGVIREGMTDEAVFLAWGRPDRVLTGSRSGSATEKWAYFDSRPVSSFSYGYSSGYVHPFYSRYGVHPRFGYGYGPYWGYGTGVDFVQQISKQVEFRNGRVTSWERVR